MIKVVENWLHTTRRGVEYVYACREPLLDNQWNIPRGQVVTWHIWFPDGWHGGAGEADFYNFCTHPGMIAEIWKDTIDYVTPYRIEVFTDQYLLSIRQVTVNTLRSVFEHVRQRQFWRYNKLAEMSQLRAQLLQQDPVTLLTVGTIPSTLAAGLNRETLASKGRRIRRWLQELDVRSAPSLSLVGNNPVL